MEPIQIKTNVLLEGAEKTMALTEAMLLLASSLARVSDDQLTDVEAEYGGGGVHRLAYLASTHSAGDFEHFFSLISDDLQMVPVRALMEPHELICDNERLPQSQELEKLALNVLQPSFSRKLYNPRDHGEPRGLRRLPQLPRRGYEPDDPWVQRHLSVPRQPARTRRRGAGHPGMARLVRDRGGALGSGRVHRVTPSAA
jgi:hypothetical protein